MKIRYFTKLVMQLRHNDVHIPKAASIAPYVYGILLFSVLIGCFGTIKTLFTYKSMLQRPSAQQPSDWNRSLASIDISKILQRNLFNLDGSLPDTTDQAKNGIVCPLNPTKSSLGYRIAGIIFGGSAQNSVVLLEQKGGNKSVVYKYNDSVAGNGKITNITKDKIFISNNGSCPEYLALEYPNPNASSRRLAVSSGKANANYSETGFERTGTNTQVTKPWVENILKNKLSSTLQDARALPNLVNGKIKGFIVTQIVPDSVYEKLGLQDDDVVSSINGIELNDAARAIQTLNSLRNETHIELKVTRNGQPITFNVNIQ